MEKADTEEIHPTDRSDFSGNVLAKKSSERNKPEDEASSAGAAAPAAPRPQSFASDRPESVLKESREKEVAKNQEQPAPPKAEVAVNDEGEDRWSSLIAKAMEQGEAACWKCRSR